MAEPEMTVTDGGDKTVTDEHEKTVTDERESRRLGLWEQVFAISQRQTGMYNVTSKIVLSSNLQIQQCSIHKALKQLTLRHPMLRATIRTDRGRMVFETGDHEPILRVSNESDAIVMEKEILEPFNDEQILWRVTMLDGVENGNKWSYTLIFTFHHTIVDGNSIVQVYRDFITYLEMALRNIEADVVSLPLKESRDEIFGPRCQCSRTRKFTQVLCYLLTDCLYPTIKRDSLVTKMIEKFRPENPSRRTKCVQINFDSQLTSRILQLCRTQGIRMNGFVCALVSHCFHELLLEYNVIDNDAVIDFNTECYVNLRRYSSMLTSDDVGLYTTHIPTRITLPEGDEFWENARRHDRQLHTRLDNDKHFNEFCHFQTALKAIGPETVSRMISLTDHRSMPYYISNLGKADIVPVVEGVEEFHCALDELHQTVGEHMTLVDGSVFIHSLVTVNGKLCWTLGYHGHQVCDQVAQRFAQLLQQRASKFCDEVEVSS